MKNNNLSKIQLFLVNHAEGIQKQATREHKIYLGDKVFRSEIIEKYQIYHLKIVSLLGTHLLSKDTQKSALIFKKLGIKIAHEAILDNLSIEETLDGLIFLEQGFLKFLKADPLFREITIDEFYTMNEVLGSFIDTLSTTIAITFHESSKQREMEKQNQIEEEKKRLYELFMQAPVPIAILIGPRHVYELSNSLNDLALGKKVIIGKTATEQFPEIVDQGIIKLLDQVYRTGKPFYGVELPFILKIPNQGTVVKYLNFTYQPLFNRAKKIEGIMVIAYDVTDQVVARKKIEESEMRFRNLAEAIPQIVYVANERGETEYFNQRWFEYTGKKRIDSATNDLFKIIHPVDYELINEKWERAKSNGLLFEAECRIRGKDQKYKWFLIRSIPLKDKNGQIFKWFGTATDIETAKQAERLISLERKKLYELFMQAPAMIAVLRGKNLEFELANPLYLKVVGKTADILGKGVREVFPELKNDGILDILFNVLKTGVPFIGKEVQLNMDVYNNGKLMSIYFNFIYQAYNDENGENAGVLVHATDVTEMVESRKRVEEAEEKFRTLAENIPNLAWMANPDGWIFWYNTRWFQYTGTTPEQMEGWGWKVVHDPETLPVVERQWKESIKNGTEFEMVFPIKGADGVFRPFLTRVNPVRGTDGKIIRWFGSNTDITKQKELERQKDEFVGIATHELKTPVTSIKAYTQVLQQMFLRKDDLVSAEYLGKMDAQLNKLTNLISDLLDVTKIQNGRLEFYQEKFDFSQLVLELVEELQRTTEKHHLNIQFAKKVMIIGDRERLGQVLTNLISNAIKYSPHAKDINIILQLEKNQVTVCVEDFGVGIEKNKQSKVFDKFFRVSGPRQETFPGLGLGLYISSEIVKRQGGKIWVNSEKGKGSTFCFSLPIKTKINNQKNTLVEDEIRHE